MQEALDLRRLRVEQALRRVGLVALLEAFGIFGLVLVLSVEYAANPFMRMWVEANMWPVAFLFNGTLAGLAAGLLLGWGIAMYWGRRSREQAVLDALRKIV